MNLNDAAHQLIRTVVDSPKTALAIPWGTAAATKLAESATRIEMLTEIQAVVSIIAGIVGIAVSSIVMYHWIIKVRIVRIQEKEAELTLRGKIK